MKLSLDARRIFGRNSSGDEVWGERMNAAIGESSATTLPTSIPSAFVGTWKVFYDNDAVRTYAITAAGTVTWTHTHGKPGPNKKARITKAGKDLLIDFGDEDKVERVTGSEGNLRIEHFHPRRKYTAGEKPLLGKGTKAR